MKIEKVDAFEPIFGVNSFELDCKVRNMQSFSEVHAQPPQIMIEAWKFWHMMPPTDELSSDAATFPAARQSHSSPRYATTQSQSIDLRLIQAIGISFEPPSASSTQNKTAWGPAVQWIPLIRLLSIIEQHGIPFLGTRGQPFDPRELVWTSALGKGGEAVATLVTSLDTPAVHKRFTELSSMPNQLPSSAAGQSYFNAGSTSIYQELAVLAHASLNNVESIIRLLAIDKNYSYNYFSIIIELAELRTLREYLANHKHIDEVTARQFCHEVTSALEYLHSEEILHNDVKMENILITRNGAKLSDFGHAIFNFKHQSRKQLIREHRLIGTKRWAAPELYDSGHVEKTDQLFATSDIYSLGFVIACVVAGRDIFAEFNDPRFWDDLKCNDEIISRLPETISADSAWASQILKNTLRLKASDRFDSASKILVSLTDIGYYSLEYYGLTSRIDSVNYLSSGRQNLPSSSF